MNAWMYDLKYGCLFSLLLLMFLAQGCDKQTDPPVTQPPAGILMGHSACGGYGLSAALDTFPDNMSCIEYNYVGDSILYLRHVNTGFNCCSMIDATVAVEGDEITVTETESYPDGSCHCLCLFDLDYEIYDIQPTIFTISVNSQYDNPEDDLLQFTVDLSESKSGVFCVERDHYPWQE